jgi:type II secretory pathway component PulM
MTDIFSTLSGQQKQYLIFGGGAIVFVVVITLVIYPVFQQHYTLAKKISQQYDLTQYLLDSQKHLVDSKIFPKLHINSARTTIQRAFTSIKISASATQGDITVSAKNQNFSKILRAISTLKLNHGIVASKAQIDKTNEGLVDATITFKFP